MISAYFVACCGMRVNNHIFVIMLCTPAAASVGLLNHVVLSSVILHHTQMMTLLTMRDLLDSAILINMNVQAVRLVIHGAHAVGLEDAVLLGQILLCESHLIMLFPQLLPHKLTHPILLLTPILTLQSRNHKRHIDIACLGEGLETLQAQRWDARSEGNVCGFHLKDAWVGGLGRR